MSRLRNTLLIVHIVKGGRALSAAKEKAILTEVVMRLSRSKDGWNPRDSFGAGVSSVLKGRIGRHGQEHRSFWASLGVCVCVKLSFLGLRDLAGFGTHGIVGLTSAVWPCFCWDAVGVNVIWPQATKIDALLLSCKWY